MIPPSPSNKAVVEPFREKFGVRFLVEMLSLNIRLAPLQSGDHPLQELMEPFFVRFAIFDLKEGRRISEYFHCDINSPELKALVSKSSNADTKEAKLNGIQAKWLLQPALKVRL